MGDREVLAAVRPGAGTALALLITVTAVAVSASGVVQFTDVTDEAGVRFVLAGELHSLEEHEIDWPGFPEIMGGGACWADVDGDGFDDLYLVNQQYNPENPFAEAWTARADPTNRLYANEGDGTFRDVTERAGVEARRFGYGCSAADYDGDGDVDLFVSTFGDGAWGGNLLYRNDGDGLFTDVADEAGVAMTDGCGEFPCFSTSSAWADYDLDGDLDLSVGNYVESDLDDLFRGPNLHVAQINWLFRNDGDGTFTEVAGPAGVAGNPTDAEGGKTLGVVWFDYDNDGDLDLYNANDEMPNDLYRNNGDGTFTEVSEIAGVANPFAGMGVTAGDYDNDGYMDLFFTHYFGEDYGFYRNLGDGTFEDRSSEDDLANSRDLVGWGTAFVDLDRDMDLDIFHVSGHTEPSLADYNMRRAVYLNEPEDDPEGPGDRRWVDVSEDSGAGVLDESVARGAAFADHDLDGDTDVAIVSNGNQSAVLLEASGVEGRWLYVQLRQPGMNRFGVGARVLLEAGGVIQHREVQTGTSYLSQNTLNVEFGLAENAQADRITVQWPGGGTTILEDVPADRVVRIDRATGSFVTDTLSPRTAFLFDGPGADGWFRGTTTVRLETTDRAVGPASGVSGIEAALADAAFEPYNDETFTFTDEGIHPVHARSVDALGNREPRRTELVRLDLTLPTSSHTFEGTPGANGWWVGDVVRVHLAGEDALSGISLVEFRLDGGPWTTFEDPVVVDVEGTHVLEHRAVDVAGNVGETSRVDVLFDPTPPDAVLARPVPGGLYVGEREVGRAGDGAAVVVTPAAKGGEASFEVQAHAADATSGVDLVVFAADDRVRASVRVPPYTWTWDLREESPGEHHVAIFVVDVAGNVAADGRDVEVVGPVPALPGSEDRGGPTLPLFIALLGVAFRRRPGTGPPFPGALRRFKGGASHEEGGGMENDKSVQR